MTRPARAQRDLDLTDPDDCIRLLAAALPRKGPYRESAMTALATVHLELLQFGKSHIDNEQLVLVLEGLT